MAGIAVPKYRTYDDVESKPDALALSLMDLVQPAVGVTWDLIPWAKPIQRLDYKMASRTMSQRQVTLAAGYTAASDPSITLDATTRKRVTAGHVLYHHATKTRLVLDSVNTTSGVAVIRSKLYGPGGSATNIASGQVLAVIGHSEHYDEINATSRFETTDKTVNYIQDLTERLDFARIFLQERRQWGVDEEMLIGERMNDVMKDLNGAILYGVPLDEAAGQSALTAGFDYMVEAASPSAVIAAAVSGTPDIADIRTVAHSLYKGGVGPQSGVIALMNPDVFAAYEGEGLADLTANVAQGDEVYLGAYLKGVNVSGIGAIPFYVDPSILDSRVRFMSTANARKSLYMPGENLRVVDEPSLGNSKNDVSTIQMRWGTVWNNAGLVNRILDTGL